MDILHPVGDGLLLGTVQVVGGFGDGVSLFDVLTPSREDASNYIALTVTQGVGFDTIVQARGPITLGDGVMRARLAVLAGNGGVELAVSLWGEDPRRAVNASKLIAQTKNFTIWHRDWQEYALALIGRQADQIAAFMGNLWLRVVVVSASGGSDLPTLGIGALWLEVPPASEVTFNTDLTTAPENTFVTVRTFSGRSGRARRIGDEWFDEAGLPFEIDKHSLPTGADGNIQASRGINGWGQ